ncbi:NAD(P)/FAD-dependent oxidoreductase [Alcanivorax sp. NBRC 102024]|uniref:flavin-containing monooxygenase n=1 Tax=Alcanivorax sp. NBRC 102024 TaxID=1113895 RepID=UPI0009ECE506|nr:NAD(P)/FAD-dependent oxidoreductase [Alcanivorax sp. NBRC 102024]
MSQNTNVKRFVSTGRSKGTSSQSAYGVLIIGAGFSGIGVAIQLEKAGLGDYMILEAGEGVGGAWHFNTYPGVAVDIPSFSYSFSFEKNPNWSRVFAKGNELKSYAEHCVKKYKIESKIALNTSVVGCDFDEANDLWCVRTGYGKEFKARFLVGATGVLNQPKKPEIKGVDDFAGITMHTARWDHSVDIKGKRVGIIGTGASALQVIPEIAPLTKQLTVFQRTPIWVLPKPDAKIPGKIRKLLSKYPLIQAPLRLVSQSAVEVGFVLTAHYHKQFKIAKYYEKLALAHLEKQVEDYDIRQKLTPKYGFGCKRPSASNNYLPTFNRSNVKLVVDPIDYIDEKSVHTQDRAKHDFDILICATGFKVFENGNMPPFPVKGVSGLDLEKWWDNNRYQAYEGVSIPGFPNFFMVLGPNGFNGASYFQLIEMQARHIVRCLKSANNKSARRVEIKPGANKRFFVEMKSRSKNQVFFSNNCGVANSYYFDKHGDVPFRPSTSLEAHWRSFTFPLSDYEFSGFDEFPQRSEAI